MTDTNKAVRAIKEDVYELMNAGEVYDGHNIVELSEGKFTRQQASNYLRKLWTLNLLEIIDPPTRPRSYRKLPGKKFNLYSNH
jgi:hypothetical protein